MNTKNCKPRALLIAMAAAAPALWPSLVSSHAVFQETGEPGDYCQPQYVTIWRYNNTGAIVGSGGPNDVRAACVTFAEATWAHSFANLIWPHITNVTAVCQVNSSGGETHGGGQSTSEKYFRECVGKQYFVGPPGDPPPNPDPDECPSTARGAGGGGSSSSSSSNSFLSSLRGNPVNAVNGNKHEVEVDYADSGSLLQFSRTYNSQDSAIGVLGAAWRHRFSSSIRVEEYLQPAYSSLPTRSSLYGSKEQACTSGWPQVKDQAPGFTDTSASYENGQCKLYRDGKVVKHLPVLQDPRPAVVSTRYVASRPGGNTIVFEGPGMVGPPDSAMRLSLDGTDYLLDDGKGNVERYDSSGRLLSISDTVRPTHTLSYAGGRLSVVTDRFGRTLQFGYDELDRLNLVKNAAGKDIGYDYDAAGRLSKVTYEDGEYKQYLYGDEGLPNALIGVVDQNGDRFATWDYDTSGRAILSEHAGGADRTTFEYSGDTTTIHHPAGAIEVMNFAPNHSRKKFVSGTSGCPTCSAQQSATHDSNGFVDSSTDFNGNTTTYVRDALGRETSRTEASGTPQARTITTTWHATFRLPLEINEPGRRTTYTYDAQGNRLTETVTDTGTSESRTTTWTYTGLGLVDTADGPRTDVVDVTDYDYDAQGNLIRITNALGQVTEIPEHDAHGNPLRIVDANGVETTLTYDLRQRLKTRTVAGAVTSFDYDGVGQLTKVTLPGGSFIEYTYDPAHRLTGIADNLGSRITYTLDAAGNRTKEEVFDPGSSLKRTQSQVFDLLGRLKEIHGANAQVTDFGYDAQGNRTRETQAGTFNTTSAYDALNRVKQVTDAADGITQYGYNALDQLESVTDPKNLTTTYTYNALGDLTQQASPDTGTTTYTYDSAGNRKTQLDARAIGVTYAYDALNRLALVDYPGTAEDVSYSYDGSNYSPPASNGVGRLTGITDESGTTTLFYDARGNVTQETRLIAGTTYTTSYAYDPADRLTGMTYPSGRQVTYERDTTGRISQVTTTVDGVTSTLADSIEYLPFGPVKKYTLGNGVVVDRTHDLDYRLSRYTDAGVDPVQDVELFYDPRNNIEATLDAITTGRSQTLGYDALSRLASAEGQYGLRGFTYDGVGNRLSQTVVPAQAGTQFTNTYAYSADSHRLASITGAGATSFAYDNAGNATAKGDLALTYNNAGRLAEAVIPAQAGIQSVYSASGQRVRKDVGDAGTIFRYDRAGHLIAETGTGTNLLIKREYVWLEDMPLALDQIAQRPEVIVDNDQATVTGAWSSTTAVAGFHGADYLSHAPAGEPPGTLILDDLDATATKTGIWTVHPRTNNTYGNTHQSAAGNAANALFTWNAAIPAAGRYRVYARWAWNALLDTWPAASNTPYRVHHVGGETTIRVNQRIAHGRWVPLGEFEFSAGNAVVSVAGGSANGRVIADAVRFVPITGTSNAAESVHWSAPDAATYEVYARWPAHINQAVYAPFSIEHAGGRTFQHWNQGHGPYGNTWNLLGTFTFNGNPGQGVTLGSDPEAYVAADAVRFVPTSETLIKESTAFFHTDHLNTPQKLTDENQDVVWDASYEPFGEVSATTSEYLLEQPLRFPGQYFDAETGLHYNWNRYMDPATGRYLQSDPVGLAAGLNTYGYAGQNPLVYFDFDGLKQTCLPGMRCTGDQDNPNLPGTPDEPTKPKRPKCAESTPNFATCMSCCNTPRGNLASGGGSACAEECMRREGITKKDEEPKVCER